MKVLHVVPTYAPAYRYGGPIRSVHALARASAAEGHEVDVFTTQVDGPQNLDVPLGVPVDRGGVRVHYFPVPRLRRLYYSPAMAAALRESVRNYDLVHLHSVFLWPTWAAARSASRQGVPFVISPRGMLVKSLIKRRNPWIKRAWLHGIERGNFARASAVHFTSELERIEAEAIGFGGRTGFVIPNGVDLPSVATAYPETKSAERRVLFLGRINPKKGLDRLLAALPAAPSVELHIAGPNEGGEADRLRAQCVQLGLTARVHFEGTVDDARRDTLLAAAHALVLPSHQENFGNVVLEALAAGRPALVTSAVGAASIVEASGGGAVVEGTVESLQAALRSIEREPQRWAECGRRGPASAVPYAWDQIAPRMIEAYGAVATGSRPGSFSVAPTSHAAAGVARLPS